MNIPAHFCTLRGSYGKFQLQKSCTSILPGVRSEAFSVGLSIVQYCIVMFVVFFLCLLLPTLLPPCTVRYSVGLLRLPLQPCSWSKNPI